MTAKKALEALDFGSVNSEGEEGLDRLFVRTRDFDNFLKRNTYLALGAKGTGKSALFELFTGYEETARKLSGDKLDGVIIASGTGLGDLNELATRELQELKLADGSYDHNRIWELYIAVKSALAIDPTIKISSGPLKDFLVETGTRKDYRVASIILDLWEKYVSGGPNEVKVGNGKSSATFNSPTTRKLDVVGILADVDSVLKKNGKKLWLLFDKIDEIWPADRSERRRSLEGLLTEVMQIRKRYSSIEPKIMLRTDLWGELDFTNKDHLTDKRIILDWSQEQLEKLLVKRAAYQEPVRDYISELHPELRRRPLDDWNPEEIRKALLTVFPTTAYPGEREADIMGWLYERVRDGRGTALPRDAIVLARECAQQQIESGPASDSTLISRDVVRHAFTRASQIRCESFLSEFPSLRQHFNRFQGQTSAEFTKAELLGLMEGISLSDDPLIQTDDHLLERLCEIGVLRPDTGRATTATKFEIPRLYRPGLGLVLRGRP